MLSKCICLKESVLLVRVASLNVDVAALVWCTRPTSSWVPQGFRGGNALSVAQGLRSK